MSDSDNDADFIVFGAHVAAVIFSRTDHRRARYPPLSSWRGKVSGIQNKNSYIFIFYFLPLKLFFNQLSIKRYDNSASLNSS